MGLALSRIRKDEVPLGQADLPKPSSTRKNDLTERFYAAKNAPILSELGSPERSWKK
jgi:hypothetical protein